MSTHAVCVQTKVFLVKMNAPCLLIFIVVQLATTTNCCSLDTNMTVDNAFIHGSCSNISCIVECYRGYIYPRGSTVEYYSCQNGEWKPMLSSCKRLPLISVTYSAIWVFDDVLPSICENVSSRLNILHQVLEETLAKSCVMLNINSTVDFTYSTLGFQVITQFTAVYRNFTNRNTLDVCIKYTTNVFPNLQKFRTLFDGVSCNNLNASNVTFRYISVSDMRVYCNGNMEVYNVTTEPGTFQHFCGTYLKDKMKTNETTIQGNLTAESTTVTATDKFTSDFLKMHHTTTDVFVQQTSTEISEWKTNLKDKMATIETTIKTYISSKSASETDKFTSDFLNIHHTTTGLFVKQISTDISEWKTSIYILIPITGVFLISGIVTLVFCRRKRIQAREREEQYETIITGGQTQYINMAESSHHYDVIGYKNEWRQKNCS